MGLSHVVEASDGLLGKGGRSPSCHGDVKGHLFGGRDESISAVEVLEKVKPFAVEAQELPAHGEVLPQAQLLEIANVHLRGEKGGLGRLDVLGAEAQLVIGKVHGPIEGYVVIGHVHVPVVVDPGGLYGLLWAG